MKNKRRVLSLALMIAIMSLNVTALAEVQINDQGKGQGNIDIRGTVEPVTTLDVDIPLSINFTIKEDRTIEWNNVEITSNCPAPLSVSILNAQPASLTTEEINGGYITAPSLVADKAFDDWDNLNRAQTKSNIAISINGFNLSVEDQEIGDIESGFSEAQTFRLEGSALYGKAWANTEDQLMKYNVILEFEMK